MIDPEAITPEPFETAQSIRSDFPVQSLGTIGLVDKVINEAALSPLEELGLDHAETESSDTVLLSKKDIFDIAIRFGYSENLAGRTWNIVTRLFTLKDNAAYYKDKSFYDKAGYDYVPLVFEKIPTKVIFGKYNSDELSDLRADSLASLLDLYDTECTGVTEEVIETKIRHKLLGDYAGRNSLKLMRKIVEVTLPKEDAVTS